MLDTLLAKLAEATLSPNVIATLIGATAALLAAFIQLRASWRRDQARSRKPQEPAKPRRAPLLWMIVLTVAAAVGGFTAAMFLIGRGLGDADEIRVELRQRVAQLNATAERFERAAPASPVSEASAAPVPMIAESLASIAVAPCRLRVFEPPAAAPQPCTETDALRVALCAAVPAHASVLKVAKRLKRVFAKTREHDPLDMARLRQRVDHGLHRDLRRRIDRMHRRAGS